jgi:signal peptidase I
MESTLLVGDFLLVNKAVCGGCVPPTHLRLAAPGVTGRGRYVACISVLDSSRLMPVSGSAVPPARSR